jgi:hypothetical protein
MAHADRVGVGVSSREIEVCDDQEEESASDEDVVVVLRNQLASEMKGESPSLSTSLMFAKAVGPASVMPTFTMKCDAAASPITFERRVIGRTSAPYL